MLKITVFFTEFHYF